MSKNNQNNNMVNNQHEEKKVTVTEVSTDDTKLTNITTNETTAGVSVQVDNTESKEITVTEEVNSNQDVIIPENEVHDDVLDHTNATEENAKINLENYVAEVLPFHVYIKDTWTSANTDIASKLKQKNIEFMQTDDGRYFIAGVKTMQEAVKMKKQIGSKGFIAVIETI